MRQQNKKYHLLYDNTLNGLLSAIFDVYRLKLNDFEIIPSPEFQNHLFQPILQISTNKAKANRIKISIKRKTGQNLLPYLYNTFEKMPQKEKLIYQFMVQIFETPTVVNQ